MSGLTTAKLALAVIAAIVWGYGARSDQPNLRWIGIALLAVAVLLRFVRPRGSPQ